MSSNCTQRHLIINFLTNFYWTIIDFLAYSFDFFANHYYEQSIGKEYRKEYHDFHIESKDNVLHIGCGIFPLTEITLAKETDATITGIDKKIGTIEKATKSIYHYGFEKRVQILHGNGEDFPVSNFTVIIISSCASSKIKILNHIVHTADIGTKIIIREVDTSVSRILNILQQHHKLSNCGTISHHPFPFYSPFGWESQCYIKRE